MLDKKKWCEMLSQDIIHLTSVVFFTNTETEWFIRPEDWVKSKPEFNLLTKEEYFTLLKLIKNSIK